MNTPPVIQTLLDTDLYKFTMMQAILHHHPADHPVGFSRRT